MTTYEDVLETFPDGWQCAWVSVPQVIDGHTHLVVVVSHVDAPIVSERFVCMTQEALPTAINDVLSAQAEMRECFWEGVAEELARNGEMH